MARFVLGVRVFLFGALAWLALAVLWMALPCPPALRSPSRVLEAGDTLTRVYDIENFYPYRDKSPVVERARKSGRTSFALEYSLDGQQLSLDIGDTRSELPPGPGEVQVFPPFDITAKSGDQDGINPPWFARADATLLFWWIHRDTAVLGVRWRRSQDTEKGDILELWPDSQYWSSHSDPQDTPSDLVPLLTISGYFGEASGPLMVALPSPPTSSSPSVTYPVRVGIINIIAPVGLLFYTILETIGWYGIIAIIVLLHLYGRKQPVAAEIYPPPYDTTTSFQRPSRMWGATGPLDDHSETYNEYPVTEIPHARGFRWFFQSSSPLDELLASYDLTRPLTQPLLRRQPHQAPQVTSTGNMEQP